MWPALHKRRLLPVHSRGAVLSRVLKFSFHRFSGLATLLERQYLLHMIAPSPCMSAGDVTNHHVADISGRSFKFQPPCPQIWPWGSLTCFYWKCKQMLLLSRRERSASICYRYRGNLLSGCSWMIDGLGLHQERLCTECAPAQVVIEIRTKFETSS